MARTAEVVTMEGLKKTLKEAKGHFAKAVEAKRIAQGVKDNAEAFKMLNESAEIHEAEGLKGLRKITVKVVNALSEHGGSADEVEGLLKLAATFGLFPEKEEKKAEEKK